MDVDCTFKTQLQWALSPPSGGKNDPKAEHVKMSTFVKRFQYTNEISADQAYLQLIQCARIPMTRRSSLMEQYKAFKVNRAKQFWESRQIKSSLRSVAKRAAVVIAEAGLQEAQNEYSIYPPATSPSLVPTPTTSSAADEETSDDKLEAGKIDKLPYDSDEGSSVMQQTPKSLSPTLPSSKICSAPLSSSSASSPEIFPVPASSSSTLPTTKTKKRKTNTEAPDMSTWTKRYEDMNPSDFWRLSSGRHVETVLFQASITGQATFKMRSYTIDFDCQKTRALFTDEEWDEMSQLNDFELPRLPKSTIEYVIQARKALINGKHVASVPVPLEDRTHLYRAKPSPFENNGLSETYWRRQAYPILEDLLSDIDGITMVDGEEQDFGSTTRKDKHRKMDLETLRVRKELGRKPDLIARDTTNSRDWLVVESVPDWDESDVLLFKELHMIATHRTEEASSSQFRDSARFFSLCSGGKFTTSLRICR
ncbi:hypothetical protein BGX20_005652 [Mortierella sp. AD010]|nr:hypothetical protein BGX20_005652 [Mortierella sp. AD010]